MTEPADTVQEMTRDCGHSTGDDQRLRTQYRGLPEPADTVQGMTRDCGHSTGDDQETADSRGDDQRLQTVQKMTRDCRQQYRG
ncbi:unnamed protein product [Staurois parvus]|uniref:Uncharacterized protein n=1 Tax=Staurois parvus TaxID=386267 RepID=A0ABN9CH02_9NEOB|nr:unnamed protein product [Staurois parvus]